MGNRTRSFKAWKHDFIYQVPRSFNQVEFWELLSSDLQLLCDHFAAASLQASRSWSSWTVIRRIPKCGCWENGFQDSQRQNVTFRLKSCVLIVYFSGFLRLNIYCTSGICIHLYPIRQNMLRQFHVAVDDRKCWTASWQHGKAWPTFEALGFGTPGRWNMMEYDGSIG